MVLRVIAFCLLVTSWLAASDLVPFAGAAGQLTTFSSAASSAAAGNGLSVSKYEPENGPGIQVFGGVHLNNWISLQANYVWRSNDIMEASSSSTGAYFSERRSSSQTGGMLDGLVYFRPLKSRIRPFLGCGVGVLQLSSEVKEVTQLGASAVLPPAKFSSVRGMLDVPVGVDVFVTHHFAFRYSYSEMRRHNDFADQLVPRGSGALLDFQNMFGLVFQP